MRACTHDWLCRLQDAQGTLCPIEQCVQVIPWQAVMCGGYRPEYTAHAYTGLVNGQTYALVAYHHLSSPKRTFPVLLDVTNTAIPVPRSFTVTPPPFALAVASARAGTSREAKGKNVMGVKVEADNEVVVVEEDDDEEIVVE